jgi:hypothetical protein
MMILNADEKTCIRRLAELFERNQALVRDKSVWESFGLSPERRIPFLTTMAELGVIVNLSPTNTDQFRAFEITSKAVQITRELDEQEKKGKEPEDIVAKVQETARKHPVVAWVIIGFILLTAAITLVNQGVQFLVTIGVIDKR